METAYSRYEILETLGTGVTSRVDKARDPVIGRTVALKTFLQGFGSCDLQQQFAREAQIIGRLSHPNIVALYDVGTNKDGVPYFVMEYVSGRTLEAVMAGGGAMPLARAALWAADLAGALSLAHRANIIHGDIKPANIIVTPEGQVKLGDFGVARFATQTSGYAKVMGTPAYLSPEQIQGQLQDTRSDLFSLGIILYQMACGVRPFNGSSIGAVCAQIIACDPPPPSHHNPSLPPTFDRVVMRCLSKDPAKRYPTAEALAASLYPFARNNEPIQPKPARPSLLSWWNRPIQQKEVWIAGTGLILILTTGFAINARHKRPVLAASTVPASTVAPSPLPSSANPSADVSFATPVQGNALTAASFGVTDDSAPVVAKDSANSAPDSPAKVSRMHPLPAPPKKNQKKIAPEPSPAAPALPAETDKPVAAQGQTPQRKDTGSLSIQVVSAVANEKLAIYAGSELLLSTPLESAHIGETLHFDRPLSVGSHALRVALYNANSELHVQKEGLAEVVADGPNTLGIRINRRPKLLIRKETALEISWPNQLSADAR
jgi:serine/threonine protein kinase